MSQEEEDPSYLRVPISQKPKRKDSLNSIQSSALSKYGYKQELYVGFNAFMNFTFSFTSIAVITAMCLQLEVGLEEGGPSVMIWGWIVCCILTFVIGLSLAEITSAYPATGSVYIWAGILSNSSWAPISSYTCGWMNLIGNAANDSSFAYGFAYTITALVQLITNGEKSCSKGVEVIISIITILLWSVKNTLRLDQQGWFNNASAIYQFLSTIVILMVLMIYPSDLSSSDFVWFSFVNETGYSSNFYAVIIGILFPLFALSGYEGGATLSEETQNAQVNAPKGLLWALVISFLSGFFFLIAVLYAMQGNIQNAMYGLTDVGVVNVINIVFTIDGITYLKGAVGITVVLIMNIFLSGFSHMTVTIRVAFAMVRDGALPFSDFLYTVDYKTKNPLRVTILVFVFESMLCLLPLVSNLAFIAIASISTIGLQISYAIPIILRLIHNEQFVPGPFNLGKRYFTIGMISFIWLVITSLIMFFPHYKNVSGSFDYENFNYTGVVLCGLIMLGFVHWNLPEKLGGAKHSFIGPRIIENKHAEFSIDAYNTFTE